MGLKHIKVPEKKVFLTNTSTEQALVNFKVEQLNGDSRIGIISDDLKILAEPIKSDDRCLSEQEINELFILLENSHYRDFDLGNFVPSKDGLYIIDTELKSFAGDQVWGKLSRLREAGCIQENNKPLFDELIQKKIQKFSQEKPNFCYRQLKFLVDQHENGITTDRIDEYKALIKKYEEVNFSIGKVFAFKRSELNL
ncbi:MAG: hypothetical protein KDK76_02535 [Chlamydiia bacterium]|nr:hypothetical protein [Chlamydiia bacterium]